jgi:hypothetical protein
MRRLMRALVILALLWPALLHARTSTPHTRSVLPDPDAPIPAPSELESRPRSELERSLMGEIACTCGTCGLEPISTCRCEFAAKVRAEVQEELDRQDVSTEAARRAAEASVRASLAARYGPRVLRQRLDLDRAAAGLFVVALGVAVTLRVRSIRRRRRGSAGDDSR